MRWSALIGLIWFIRTIVSCAIYWWTWTSGVRLPYSTCSHDTPEHSSWTPTKKRFVICVCTCVCACMSVCVHVWECVCVHVWECVCVHVWECVCVCMCESVCVWCVMCVCECICVCVCVLCVCVCVCSSSIVCIKILKVPPLELWCDYSYQNKFSHHCYYQYLWLVG